MRGIKSIQLLILMLVVGFGCDNNNFSASGQKQPQKPLPKPADAGSGKKSDEDGEKGKKQDSFGDPLSEFKAGSIDKTPKEIIDETIPTCFADHQEADVQSAEDSELLQELDACLSDLEDLNKTLEDKIEEYISENIEDVAQDIRDFISGKGASDKEGVKSDSIGSPNNKGSDVTEDSEESEEIQRIRDEIAALPGQEIVKLGINFEDNASDNSDYDYNDAVLCFDGKFKLSGNIITSLEAQTVKATTFSASACSHDIKVVIKDREGKVEFEKRYSSRFEGVIDLPFTLGSNLFVSLLVAEESKPGCSDADLNTAKQVKAKANFCNAVADSTN